MTANNASTGKKAPQRSKRLRKKLFQDEFATFGFELECEFKSDLSDETISEFVDNFFIDAINAEGLAFGGGLSSKRLSGFVGSNRRYGSATEEDKAKLLAWLNAQPQVAKAELGDIIDANYYI
ncbi:YggL family protein [Cellvibrio sp. NN19]|uniref:YggL 50S ribosome-binding family protein n=1 Tax=Cellvibrio chitinivorans TaxID=3102792 RepID=UPI002B40704E|nr:YggL family protein [Cellvibrio sp. NN19]